jgi:hypothetical protein
MPKNSTLTFLKQREWSYVPTSDLSRRFRITSVNTGTVMAGKANARIFSSVADLTNRVVAGASAGGETAFVNAKARVALIARAAWDRTAQLSGQKQADRTPLAAWLCCGLLQICAKPCMPKGQLLLQGNRPCHSNAE